MDADTRKIPSHEVTYARLRDMILFGHLAPGQPVTIQGLIADLGAGMTPVREAIRRLTAEGALFRKEIGGSLCRARRKCWIRSPLPVWPLNRDWPNLPPCG